jgi:hypothetical protein
MKQVFFLVEREERVKGNTPPHSWKDLTRSIKNKNHVVHDVYKYRLHPSKDKHDCARLLRKVERYVERLSKKYF